MAKGRGNFGLAPTAGGRVRISNTLPFVGKNKFLNYKNCLVEIFLTHVSGGIEISLGRKFEFTKVQSTGNNETDVTKTIYKLFDSVIQKGEKSFNIKSDDLDNLLRILHMYRLEYYAHRAEEESQKKYGLFVAKNKHILTSLANCGIDVPFFDIEDAEFTRLSVRLKKYQIFGEYIFGGAIFSEKKNRSVDVDTKIGFGTHVDNLDLQNQKYVAGTFPNHILEEVKTTLKRNYHDSNFIQTICGVLEKKVPGIDIVYIKMLLMSSTTESIDKMLNYIDGWTKRNKEEMKSDGVTKAYNTSLKKLEPKKEFSH